MSGKTNIELARIYESFNADGTYRILVDRLWPRGIKKSDLQFDEWNKEITPSTEIRRWFGHKSERFDEFARLYEKELALKESELNRIRDIAKKRAVTLLYAAKDPKINHAVILKKCIMEK